LRPGDDPRQPPGILDDSGVLTKPDSASRHSNSRVLVHNQAAPGRAPGSETPGTRVDKM
jgi:hypothetical protein